MHLITLIHQLLLVFSLSLSLHHVLLFIAINKYPKESKKRALGSLSLELLEVVSLHVVPGNQAEVFWKNSQCSQTLSNLSSPYKLY